MNILFLTPQLPYPPDRGTALRNWGLLRELATRHRMSLLSFADAGSPAEPLLAATGGRLATEPVPRRGQAVRLRDLLLNRHADMALRLASASFAARLAEWLAREHFDVVQIEGIELARYLPVILAARRGSRPLIVFDDHNVEWQLQQRAYATDARDPRRVHAALYSLIQWYRLRSFEAGICHQADRIVAVSDADATALRALAPGRPVVTVPNGIDLEAYRLPVAGSATAYDLLFTGKMDYRPNVDAMLWFTDAIWPRVRAARPATTLGIVGQQPHPRLAAVRGRPGITLTGFVPDVRPYLARAGVYVAPLRMGAGTRFKLLEAMALERAIVATPLATEGLTVSGAASGQSQQPPLVLAGDPEAFAAAVLELLDNPARRALLGTAARTHVAAHFDWQAIVPRLEAAYA